MSNRSATLILLCLGAITSGCRDDRPLYASHALPGVGGTPPAFALPLVDQGGTVSPASLRGRPALIALWSTTCSASRLAYDGLVRLHEQYSPKGVQVIVLADDPPEKLKAFADSARPPFPIAPADGRLDDLFDRADQVPESDAYRVKFALPSYLVLDAEGIIAHRHTGVEYDPAERFAWARAALDSLLVQ